MKLTRDSLTRMVFRDCSFPTSGRTIVFDPAPFGARRRLARSSPPATRRYEIRTQARSSGQPPTTAPSGSGRVSQLPRDLTRGRQLAVDSRLRDAISLPRVEPR